MSLKKLQQTPIGKENKGVIAIIDEAEATCIWGIYASDGYYVDSKGNKIQASNTSFITKSNAEYAIGKKLIFYPELDSVEDLLNWGFNAGVEGGLYEVFGGAIDFANLSPEGKGYSIQAGPPPPLTFSLLAVDVYFSVGYTEEYTPLTDEELERAMEIINNMNLGGL